MSDEARRVEADALDERTEAEVRGALASAPELRMPDDVWARLSATLAEESRQRHAAGECRRAPLMPEIDKDILPETRPSAARS